MCPRQVPQALKMATKVELVLKRSGQRASAIRLITGTVVDRGDIGEYDIDVFDTVCKKLADKLAKIKILDGQILEKLVKKWRQKPPIRMNEMWESRYI